MPESWYEYGVNIFTALLTVGLLLMILRDYRFFGKDFLPAIRLSMRTGYRSLIHHFLIVGVLVSTVSLFAYIWTGVLSSKIAMLITLIAAVNVYGSIAPLAAVVLAASD